MFNLLFKKYKLELLDTNFIKDIKGIPTYAKIFLAIMILCSILSPVFGLMRWNIASLITIAVLVINFFVLGIMSKRKKERTRIVNDVLSPEADKRLNKIIELLKGFGVDVKDEKQLDCLIERAQKEKDYYDIWKGLRNLFKGMTTYILLPILTIFLSEFFKDTNIETILIRAGVLILVCAVIIVVLSAFATNMNDIFNRDMRNLDYFIRDVEDIKIFNSKVDKVFNSNGNVCE